jgi:hypothetical protein
MTRIRLRTDSQIIAEAKALGKPTDNEEWYGPKAEVDATPAAQPGDAWEIRWYKKDGEGPLAGYAICCPKCKAIHAWTQANNCSKRPDKGHCSHSGVSSCWDWTGSAEAGTLTAKPSLLCHTCGFHGWLTDGILSEC